MFDTPAPRYVNPYTDFGFKLLFGTEVNKELLIDFLNALLALEHPITDLRYLNAEQLGDTAADRRSVFDVYCQCTDGQYVIVEMQKAAQAFFKDRAVYYSSFPIRTQGQKGAEWDFMLSPVYTVGVLDFTFDDNPDYYHHEVQLVDKAKDEVFYDKLTYVFLEMPKFNKSIDECTTFLDKWLFVLKNLTRIFDRPVELQGRVFDRLFHAAEIAQMTVTERMNYEESLKNYRDWKNVLDTARIDGLREGREVGLAEGHAEGRAEGHAEGLVEGRAEGLAEGREVGLAEGRAEGRAEGLAEGREVGLAEGARQNAIETARRMLSKGFSVSDVAEVTGLPVTEIELL